MDQVRKLNIVGAKMTKEQILELVREIEYDIKDHIEWFAEAIVKLQGTCGECEESVSGISGDDNMCYCKDANINLSKADYCMQFKRKNL